MWLALCPAPSHSHGHSSEIQISVEGLCDLCPPKGGQSSLSLCPIPPPPGSRGQSDVGHSSSHPGILQFHEAPSVPAFLPSSLQNWACMFCVTPLVAGGTEA